MIDTHAHIYHSDFENKYEELLQRCIESGVQAVVIPATKPSEFASVLKLAKDFGNKFYGCIGVHPHHAAEIEDKDLEQVKLLCKENGIVAVGEIGLDYYYNFAPKEIQKQVFEKQLQIAKELDLPAVIHNRESDEDVLEILSKEQNGKLKFQLHCFSSSLGVLETALRLGGMISFTGNITFKKSNLDEVVFNTPDDRIMIETDAPYMAPVPYRGKRNEPSYTKLVALKIAEIKQRTLEEIIEMTTINAKKFFKLAILLFALLSYNFSFSQDKPDSVKEVQKPITIQDKGFIGVGGYLGGSTIINGSQTDANSIFSFAGAISLLPPADFKMKWLQFDVIYTYFKNSSLGDSSYNALSLIDPTVPKTIPPNIHRSLDMNLRFIANPTNVVNFYGKIGLTYFMNHYGVDEFFYVQRKDSTFNGFEDTGFGLGGGIGVSINIDLPFGTIAPSAEFTVSDLMTERTLKRRQGGFFLSQTRAGFLFYPKF